MTAGAAPQAGDIELVIAVADERNDRDFEANFKTCRQHRDTAHTGGHFGA